MYCVGAGFFFVNKKNERSNFIEESKDLSIFTCIFDRRNVFANWMNENKGSTLIWEFQLNFWQTFGNNFKLVQIHKSSFVSFGELNGIRSDSNRVSLFTHNTSLCEIRAFILINL